MRSTVPQPCIVRQPRTRLVTSHRAEVKFDSAPSSNQAKLRVAAKQSAFSLPPGGKFERSIEHKRLIDLRRTLRPVWIVFFLDSRYAPTLKHFPRKGFQLPCLQVKELRLEIDPVNRKARAGQALLAIANAYGYPTIRTPTVVLCIKFDHAASEHDKGNLAASPPLLRRYQGFNR